MTPKQRRFCEEYLLDLNATEAAKRAGASPRSAKQLGSRWLQRSDVQAMISELQAARSQRTEITADRVLQELAKIGFANMEDYTRLIGAERVVDLSNATREQLAAVSEITVDDFKEGRGDDARDVRRVKVKLADKKGALVDIGKHLGLFKDKVEITGKDGGPVQSVAMTPEEFREIARSVADEV